MDIEEFLNLPKEYVEHAFMELDRMQVYPSISLPEQVQYYQQVEAVLKLIDESIKPRELLLETWLLVDYILTTLLCEGLGLPERIVEETHVLPFQFKKKIELLESIHREESKLMPNQRSFTAFEAHPDFLKILNNDHSELFHTFLDLAARFEGDRKPDQSVSVYRNDYNRHRFVPESWFERVANLDNDWFKACKRLNKARNSASHDFKKTPEDIYKLLGVQSLEQFKQTLRDLLEKILFKPEN